jgi:purine-binding chemotaxis protein CheW
MRMQDDAPPGLPSEMPPAHQQVEVPPDGAPAVERVSYLGFLVGLEMYGLPLDHLRDVSRLKRLRRIPGAPAHVAGLMNVRGEIVCALDTRAILLLPPAPLRAGGFLIALRGFPDPLGLVVDAITDVYAIDPATVDPLPASWPAARARVSIGSATVADGVMTLLDLRQMVAQP